ncbi:hypothetical protein [Brevundimonas aurifodinae]|uniref:DUF3325 domain-containing protein n=2 Tax=Brevundimonas TaxID=41275 RepID=A0ABV1NRW3_9CAUL|nr:MAG: hypothetical protein B7Z42_16050 [Brevundimonas sp. 12-68-7]OYX30432.1 MAG: hypothetical protein B7Z01_14395 [Brevundimonas subvibrioides]
MLASAFAVVIVLTGVALAALSVLIAVQPRRALQALSRFGSTARIHFGELSLRAAIGMAFVLGGPATRYPTAIGAIGAFLVVSALILMVLPRRWHAAYSSGWAKRIPVWTVPVLAVISLAAGSVLVWVAA